MAVLAGVMLLSPLSPLVSSSAGVCSIREGLCQSDNSNYSGEGEKDKLWVKVIL